jgi:hypothetical protein
MFDLHIAITRVYINNIYHERTARLRQAPPSDSHGLVKKKELSLYHIHNIHNTVCLALLRRLTGP